MSLDSPEGQLGLDGYVFYMNGCTGDTCGESREFSSAHFTIGTSAATAVPEPLTLSLFGAGVAVALVVRRRKKKAA